MSALGGGMNFYGELPPSYDITVNMDNPLITKIMAGEDKDGDILRQVTDLALLANGLLKGKALSDFIARSRKFIQ